MNKKSVPPKTTKSVIKKETSGKSVISKNASKPRQNKVEATKSEVKDAGAKVMKKYSVAIKKLADR